MKNLVLFIDGAVHAAIWTLAPLLIPSLIFAGEATNDTSADGSNFRYDNDNIARRPLSANGALMLTGSRDQQLDQTSHSNDRWMPISEAQRIKLWQSLPGKMAWLLVIFLMGRALGSMIVKSQGINTRLNYLLQRVRSSSFCPGRIKYVASWKITCHIASGMVPLLMLNWGLGVYTFGGWVTIRFLTSFISGALITRTSKSYGGGRKDHANEESVGSSLRDVEEGHSLLDEESAVSSYSASAREPESITSIQQLEKPWLDAHWIAGVATSALLSGFLFYPLNRLTVAFHHSFERLYVFLIFLIVGLVVDRYLCLYYSTKQSTTTSSRALSPMTSFSDAGIVGSDGSTIMSNVRSYSGSSSSTMQRRKQQSQQNFSLPIPKQPSESQPVWESSPTPSRRRLDSSSSIESEQFFDCLDDVELGFEEKDDASNNLTNTDQNYDNQIAVYARRKIVYSDGTPALVPGGESIATIPPGYIALYSDNRSKAQSIYQMTQQWRRNERIYSIHTRPHKLFPKIKDAYPHVIHGFTPDGMPVVYESPGRMNLKQLFRNGCHVEDMIFHYCYLMEYLSNLESVLTELYSNEYDDDEWQEELAGYAHAKQTRLQSDPISFGFVVIMDISGASPTSLSGDVISYLQRAGETNSLHYPGSMRRLVAVQAPFWLGAAWGAIKGVLPASVTTDMFSGKQTMAGGLKQYIDENQIPAEYGGKSKFKLGEHPFEVGLRKLVQRQGEDVAAHDNDDVFDKFPMNPLHGVSTWNSSLMAEKEPPSHHSLSPYFEKENASKNMSSSIATSGKHTTTREWDDLETDYVLIVATTLHILLHSVIGSIELALPLCVIYPTLYGGMGFEARRNGYIVFASCAMISLTMKRTKFSRVAWDIAEKSPLRGFRIGIGAMGFFLLCISLISSDSAFGFLCLVAYFALVYFSGAVGTVSVEYLLCVALRSFKTGNDTLPILFVWMQGTESTIASGLGKMVGYFSVASIFRWSTRQQRPFPLGASFHLCLAACLCWILYIVSFSLRTVSVSATHTSSQGPNNKRRKKKSQFAQAMLGWLTFVKELFMVAYSDILFLVDTTVSRRGGAPSKMG